MGPEPLAEWSNFYVIVGSSSAALTGLTFVVIALVAETQRVNSTGLRVFVTPTIVHFGAVLALSAFLCVPRQTAFVVALGMGLAGIGGFAFVAVNAMRLRHLQSYVAVREDWIWHVGLPSLAYGGLLTASLPIGAGRWGGLYGVGAASVLLLFIGIHNAWDIAVWMTLRRGDAAQSADPPRESDAAGGH